MPIVQRQGKITAEEADVIAGKADRIENFRQHDPRLREVLSGKRQEWPYRDIHSTMIAKVLGKPMLIMREYESSPGLWLLDDTDTGITFLVWSDGYKKNPWKGTSYEAVFSRGHKKNISEAVERLFGYIKDRMSMEMKNILSIEKFIENTFYADEDDHTSAHEQAHTYLKALVAEAVTFFDSSEMDGKDLWLDKSGHSDNRNSDNYYAAHDLDKTVEELIALVAVAPNYFSEEDFHGAKLKWLILSGIVNENEVPAENQLNSVECEELVSRVHGYVVGSCDLLSMSVK